MRDSCGSSSSSLSCNSSSLHLCLAAFQVRLAGSEATTFFFFEPPHLPIEPPRLPKLSHHASLSEATTAGEGSSYGVEVDGIGAIGDGSTGDGAVGSSSPVSGGGIGPAFEAIWAHLRRH